MTPSILTRLKTLKLTKLNCFTFHRLQVIKFFSNLKQEQRLISLLDTILVNVKKECIEPICSRNVSNVNIDCYTKMITG